MSDVKQCTTEIKNKCYFLDGEAETSVFCGHLQHVSQLPDHNLSSKKLALLFHTLTRVLFITWFQDKLISTLL